MLKWTEEMIRFRETAEDYNHTAALTAKAAAEYYPRSGRILDAGCGTGFTSRALAALGFQVTGVDSDPAAADYLAAHPAKGVHFLHEDIYSHTPDILYDGMLCCFFGKGSEIFTLAERLCRGPVVVISRDYDIRRFGLHNIKRTDISARPHDTAAVISADDSLTDLLKARGIPYLRKTLRVDLGQPFESIDEACAFFAMHNPGAVPAPELILPKLTRILHPKYIYNYPVSEDLELVTFDSRRL